MSEKFGNPSFSKEIDPNEGKRTLEHALRLGDFSKIEALFDAGMEIDQTDFQGRTALMLLAAAGNVSGVERMLARGADVNAVFLFQDRVPMTALDAARQMNRAETAELLRSHGAKTGKEVTDESSVG